VDRAANARGRSTFWRPPTLGKGKKAFGYGERTKLRLTREGGTTVSSKGSASSKTGSVRGYSLGRDQTTPLKKSPQGYFQGKYAIPANRESGGWVPKSGKLNAWDPWKLSWGRYELPQKRHYVQEILHGYSGRQTLTWNERKKLIPNGSPRRSRSSGWHSRRSSPRLKRSQGR